jgi:hypothetical protein
VVVFWNKRLKLGLALEVERERETERKIDGVVVVSGVSACFRRGM